eukprot:7732608-Alexandrium_andersonii.AAC.1
MKLLDHDTPGLKHVVLEFRTPMYRSLSAGRRNPIAIATTAQSQYAIAGTAAQNVQLDRCDRATHPKGNR